jgi:DnaJ-class molecular chaperone
MSFISNDYYKILNLNNDCSKIEIINSYREHINRYIGLPFLTDRMIEEVKLLKIALYILSDDERRFKYDNRNKPKNTMYILNDYNEEITENTKINDRLFGDIFKKK